MTLGDFSAEELVTLEQMSGWTIEEIIELKIEGEELSTKFSDQCFREFTNTDTCEELAYGFNEAAQRDWAILFYYSS